MNKTTNAILRDLVTLDWFIETNRYYSHGMNDIDRSKILINPHNISAVRDVNISNEEITSQVFFGQVGNLEIISQGFDRVTNDISTTRALRNELFIIRNYEGDKIALFKKDINYMILGEDRIYINTTFLGCNIVCMEFL